MLLFDLVPLLKTYLDIDMTDITADARLETILTTAVGYVKSVYDYDIVDTTYTKTLPVLANKIYLPNSPVKADTIVVTDSSGVAIPIMLVQNTLYLPTNLYKTGQLIQVTYTCGVEYAVNTYNGVAENLVQLAGWLYRTADKGMEGMSQFTTGVKEGVHMYEGIPPQITDYFQSKKLMRL